MWCLCSSPFPEVAESVQEELDAYRAQEDEVKRLKSIMVRCIDMVVSVVCNKNCTPATFRAVSNMHESSFKETNAKKMVLQVGDDTKNNQSVR